eukprot:GHRR01002277.1.p1 GENE.GHRR01002277.1~~GHRR01002277.1.p1  ORF type:complete len:327 (+),score=115.19 GHRR01002277.1:235-1215(+)
MADVKDPLTFGAADEDLEDLTDHLDAALLSDPPAYSTISPLSGTHDAALSNQADPFTALASASRHNAPDIPYTTYGQLVTPQHDHQHQQAQQIASGQPAAASTTTAASSSSNQQPAGHVGSNTQGAVGSNGGVPPEPQYSMSSIPSPRFPAPANAKDQPMYVTVSEPVRKEVPGVLGMKASHIEYLVTTRSQLPGWSSPEVSVRRRFRDFVALAELLKAQFRGYFVPPRPEKNAVEGQRMSDAFIEERRVGLQKYLQKLAAHPVISRSEALQVFLETTGELSNNLRWMGMLPASASIMEGTAKFSMQLIGRESKVRLTAYKTCRAG